LEFENNRAIYDWLLDSLFEEPRPHQYEFARLSLDYTVMSKRKLLQLVEEKLVAGWDDPRLPTIAGLRRRGITPSAIRSFADRIGVAKANSRVEMSLLESCIRDDLNPVAPRVMAVLKPVKLIIDNYPAGETEWLDAPYFPHDIPGKGSRKVPFTRELYIERNDFMEEPPKGFFRMAPGRDVRLRHAYIVTCTGVVKDATGEISEIHCTYDPATRSGAQGTHKKTQTAIQWVSAAHAVPATVRLYDRLLRVADPDAEGIAFKDALNPNALEEITGAWVEPSVVGDPADTRYQFERTGYFWQDPVQSAPNALVFNRIVGLRDSWTRATGSESKSAAKNEPRREPQAAARVSEPATEGKPRIPERSAELQARRLRYAAEWGLPEDEAELITRDMAPADFFEAALAADPANPRALATWINHDLPGELKGRSLAESALTPAALAALVHLLDENVISTAGARTVFSELVASGGDPAQIVEARGLRQVADSSALLPVVARVMAANPDKVAQYRAGKTGLLGFFTGQVMRETNGAANAAVVQELLTEALNG
jgi:glutaminyl-tRNA synthetase